MSHPSRLVALVVPVLILCSGAFAQPGKKNAEGLKLLERSRTVVLDILEGKGTEEVQASIDPEAYIVNGNTYQSLLSVVRGTEKKKMFPLDPAYKIEYLSGQMADDGSSAFFVLKATSPSGSAARYHSVFLMKSDSSGLRIKHWHTSK